MTLASEDADQLIADLNAWHADIPEELQFNSPDSATSSAGTSSLPFPNHLFPPLIFIASRLPPSPLHPRPLSSHSSLHANLVSASREVLKYQRWDGTVDEDGERVEGSHLLGWEESGRFGRLVRRDLCLFHRLFDSGEFSLLFWVDFENILTVVPMQYHTHIRQRDARSLDTLRYARDTLKVRLSFGLLFRPFS